jgi:hypothetical protein
MLSPSSHAQEEYQTRVSELEAALQEQHHSNETILVNWEGIREEIVRLVKK